MRKRALRYLTLCLLGLVAIGCSDTNTVEQPPIPQYNPTPFPGFTFPRVDLANGIIPLPNNLLLDPQTGLLNLPGGDGTTTDNTVNAANSLDGFSTTAPIVIPFQGTVNVDSINSETLPVYNSATGEIAPATYSVSAADAGSVVTVVPIRPLTPGTTYIVVLSQGIISSLSNSPILSNNQVRFIQQATPLTDGNGNSTTVLLTTEQAQTLEPVRAANQAVIGAAEQLTGTNRANIPFAFSFTTQTLYEALPQARAAVIQANAGLTNRLGTAALATGSGINPNDGVTSVDEFWTTLPAAVQAAPRNAIGRIFTGTVPIPQFRANPFTDFWAQPPVVLSTVNAPFFLFLPATPGPKPAVIFQHGITRNKGDAFVLANAFNSQGLALIAIDLPLHGDLQLDAVNNTTGAPGPDGTRDADGNGFINPAKPRVTRDNIRQGVVGLYALNNAIFAGKTDLTGDGVPELVPGSIAPPFFIAQSLGSIVGTVFIATEQNAGRAVLNVPGGRLVNLILTSPAFGPPVLQGLAAAGLQPGTSDFARFVIFTQAVLDDVDPLNYAAPAVNGTLRGGIGARFLQQLSTADQVITPAAQYDLANAFGADPEFAQVNALLPLPGVTQTVAPDPGPGLFEVAGAGHGVLLNPADGPTVGVVTQAITFLGTGNIITANLRAQAAAAAQQAVDYTPYRKAVSF